MENGFVIINKLKCGKVNLLYKYTPKRFIAKIGLRQHFNTLERFFSCLAHCPM